MMEEKEKKQKKPKSKARKIVEWVFTGILAVIFGVMFIAQIDGWVNMKSHYGKQIRFGYGSFIVETDSMEDKYKVGSALVTYLEDGDKIYQRYQNGEEVDLTFFDAYSGGEVSNKPTNPENAQYVRETTNTGFPMTHRLIEMRVNEDVKNGEGRYVFYTAGINEYSEWLGSDGTTPVTIDQYQVFTEKELLGRVVLGSPFIGGVFKFITSIWGLLILLLIPSFYLIITSVIDIFKAYKDPEEAKESNKDKKPGELSEEDKKRLKEQLLEEMLNKKKGE